jgi:hypothetical protein
MFYTGENPYSGEKVYVARSQDDKRRQKSYFFNQEGEAKRPSHESQRPKGAMKGSAKSQKIYRRSDGVRREKNR